MAVAERVSAERGESLGETVSHLFLIDQNTNKCCTEKMNTDVIIQ